MQIEARWDHDVYIMFEKIRHGINGLVWVPCQCTMCYPPQPVLRQSLVTDFFEAKREGWDQLDHMYWGGPR